MLKLGTGESHRACLAVETQPQVWLSLKAAHHTPDTALDTTNPRFTRHATLLHATPTPRSRHHQHAAAPVHRLQQLPQDLIGVSALAHARLQGRQPQQQLLQLVVVEAQGLAVQRKPARVGMACYGVQYGASAMRSRPACVSAYNTPVGVGGLLLCKHHDRCQR